MKRISLVLCLALMLVALLTVNAFAATYSNIENDARFEQNGSNSDLLDLSKVIDNDYYTGSSCGNSGENWVNYRFYYDEGTTVSKVFVVLNSKGTLSNGKVYESVSENSYDFYVRLYDKYENAVYNVKYSSVNDATQIKDAEDNVLYTCFELAFDEPYSDIYMVEVPVVNNKNADVGLWEVEIYNYVCGDDEHEWVGQLCGEHCDVCGTVKDPTLACEAEEDDGDCRTAVLCKYCDSVMVASQKHVFANGETVCSNAGCVFEGKNIAKDTSITPVDVTENTYGENGEFLNWWYYSAHITDGKYDTVAHSNYWGQYKFTFNIKNPTKLSEIFIVSNSSGIYHPWGYTMDNLTTDIAVKVVIYDADGNAIQTVEYQSLDFANPNVVPIYAEDGKMTSVAYKLDTNYATASKIELFINQGVWEVEIYQHVTCDYQFIETVAPGCTTEGYDLYKCACGNERYENTVSALGHNYDEGVVTKEAGEEEDGEIVFTCQTCGHENVLAIPATGHEHSYDTYVGNSVEPTCATVGSATYQCRCGDTTEVEVPATGEHNYNVFVGYTVEPTYLKDGIAEYKCATCDATNNVNVGRKQMNTAKYAEIVKEMGGWTVGVNYLVDGNYNLGSGGSHSTNGWAFSLNYGEDYYFNKLAFVVNSVGSFPTPNFNYTEKTTKNYSFAITLYDVDGNAVWTKSTTCADAVEMTGIDANGSEFLYDVVTIELDEAVVATKLYVKINSGWDNGAGMWEVETYGLPVNYHEDHTYSVLLEQYSAPTCTTEGSGLFRCNRCEETSECAIPVLPHTFNQEVEGSRVDATCEAAGSVTMKCANCDATEVQSIAATGHTSVVDAAVAPTCTATGLTEGSHCSVCNAVLTAQEEVAALGHSYVAGEAVAPNCVDAGYTPYTCSVCGDSYNGDVVDALGHTAAIVDAVAPTCTETGLTEGSYCSVCNEVLVAQEEVAATGHNYVVDEYYEWPTCTAAGNGVYACTECGDSYESEIPATGEHQYPYYPTSTTATCTEGGINTYICYECNEYEYEEEVGPLGHDINTWWGLVETITPATCTEAGIGLYTCQRCQQNVENEIAATGHNMVNGDIDFTTHTCEVTCANGCGTTEIISTLGWEEDPIAITIPGSFVSNAVKDWTYYSFTHTEGYVTFTFDTDNINVMIKDTSEKYASQYFWGGETTWTAELMAGATYVVAICTNDGADLDIAVETTFESADIPDLGEVAEKPIVIEGVNTGYTSTGAVWYTFEVPNDAGTTVTITIEGTASVKYGLDAENLVEYTAPFVDEYGYSTYYILVESVEEATIVVNVEAPAGSMDNPLEIVVGDNAIATAGGWATYYAAFESNVNGTLTVTFESENAVIYVGTHPYQMQTPVTSGTTIDVSAYTTYFFGVTTSDWAPASFTLTAAFEEATAEMPEPDGEIGEVIGSMDVTTTDTYGYHDMYTYTAEVAGKYTFAVPVGVGFYSKAQYDAWGSAEIDFNEALGGYVTVELKAGEEYSFYVGSFTKDTWTVAIYYMAPSHICEFVETSRTESTCTVAGSVTYTCECGESYTETLELAAHAEVEIPVVLPTPSVTGYTAGTKCATCGVTLVAPVAINVTELANTKDPAFRVASASLTLQENISVNYASIVTAGYSNPYMVFVFRGGETVVTEYTINVSNGRYMFNFAGTLPQYMNENIEAYVYAETAEGEYSMNKILEYSVKQYCINQLKKGDASMNTLISDVLTYGAMTQLYLVHEPNNLITDIVKDAGYTLTPSTFTSLDASENVQKVSGDRTTGYDWKSGALEMGSSIEMVIKFAATDIEGLVAKINIDGVDTYFTSDMFQFDGTRYFLTIDFIKSYQFAETVTATFEKDGAQIGSTLTYSVNSYIYRNAENNAQIETARNLMKAIYVYGETVRAYFGN